MPPARRCQQVFDVVGQVVRQVHAIAQGVDAAARYPSAFGLAKLISFVARATVGGAPSQGQVDHAAFGWQARPS